jgi:hypothetical protein
MKEHVRAERAEEENEKLRALFKTSQSKRAVREEKYGLRKIAKQR